MLLLPNPRSISSCGLLCFMLSLDLFVYCATLSSPCIILIFLGIVIFYPTKLYLFLFSIGGSCKFNGVNLLSSISNPSTYSCNLFLGFLCSGLLASLVILWFTSQESTVFVILLEFVCAFLNTSCCILKCFLIYFSVRLR